MKSYRSISTILFIAILFMALSACVAIEPAETPTAIPTDTQIPTPTNTPVPTATVTHSPTPDIVATQRADKVATVLNMFAENGYLESMEGEAVELNLLEQNWNQSNDGLAKSWRYDETLSDFLFTAHFDWSTTEETSKDPGCSVSLGDGYQIMFAQSKIYFVRWLEGTTPLRGDELDKITGTGLINPSDQTEADFALLIQGQDAFVSIDTEITGYTLPVARTETYLGLVRSFHSGRACEMTNMMLWTPE
ncbi:MAG: hypothetical protein HZB19_09220 [Chloroflexi bacterium]|nr:hypothetical protein [Chloroflexota bacterium]